MTSDDSNHRGRSGGRQVPGGFPGVGQEFGDALHRVVGQPGDEVDEVGLGIDTGQPAVFHQRKQIGQTRAGIGVPDLQPVFRPDLERADGLLDEIVIDPRPGFAQTARQGRLLSEQIAERLAETGFRRGPGYLGLGIGKQLVGDGLADVERRLYVEVGAN